MGKINQENVLVTGASSGIGYALCKELAKRKCRIAMVARREQRLVKLAKEVNSLGGWGLPVVCDVSKRDNVAVGYKKIKQELGDISVAFLNAGIGSSIIGQNVDSQEIEQVLRTNFLGVVYWLDYLLPPMQKKNKGIIVATSSLAAYRGLPAGGSYCASKAALNALWESYQIDFLATNIRFVIVSPYFVATEMTGDSIDKGKLWCSSQEAAKRIISGVEKGKYHIAFPWLFRFFICVMRILPLSGYRLFWKIVKRGG
jgi:short-subunit dehydrogenase